MNKTLDRGKDLIAGFTPGQRGIILVVTLALALGAFALTRWVSSPTWTPLYGNLDGSDANAIVEQLNSTGVKYKLSDGGATVLVPQSQVYDLRVSLSGKGLPAGASDSGYSLLDKQSLTATDFQQNIAYRRALEGELAKTLQAIDGVQTAVVHLAMPKKDVFASEQDKTTASVLLALKSGTTLDRAEVLSITHLVAGSVEGLDPKDVTVSDSSGNMLSSPSDQSGLSGVAVEADEHTAAYEARTAEKVQQMLDRVLGAGRSVVRVNATLNYDDTQRTSEKYTQPSPTAAPLSESTETETYNGAGAGAGGALGQTFPTPATGTGGNSGAYNKTKRTANNSIDKVVEHTDTAPGTVQRLTVAVVLDAANAANVSTSQIQSLVSTAAGIDTTRGDAVQVDAVPFDTTAATEAKTEIAKAAAAQQRAQYVSIGKQAGFALLVLMILLIAWRRRRRTTVDATASDLPEYAQGPMVLPPGAQIAIEGTAVPGTGLDIPALPSPDEIALARQKMRDQVAELVDNQPEDVARVIQGWLAERS